MRNNWLKAGLCAALLGVSSAFAAAQNAQPVITFHTNLYDMYAEANKFSLVIAGSNGGYIDVDCGYGAVEYEVEDWSFDSENQTVNGTTISCQVSSEGIVKIYADEGVNINYFNASGCYITDIQFAKPEEVNIIDLEHNELEGLDLSDFCNLQIAYLNDNPFGSTGLKIGPNKPYLTMLEMNITDNLDPSFNLSDYPSLLIFSAMNCPSLRTLDPTGCPYLVKLSIDATNVSSLDVSKNPELWILNISDTGISNIDLSNNTKLQELYITHESSSYNRNVKFTSIDLTHNPNLVYFFASGNLLSSIDLSNNPALDHLWLQNNQFSSIDLSNNTALTSVRLENNNFTFATLPEDPGTWNEYVYSQRPLQLPKSIKVGTTLDFSEQVLRSGTQTYAQLFSVSDSNPASAVELDESYFSYADGKVTILKDYADSVYIAFANTMFPEYELTTVKFKAKTAEDYGANDLKMTFMPAASAGATISLALGMEGASASSPKLCYVDFGDGQLKTFQVVSESTPAATNVSGTRTGTGNVKLYVPEGEKVLGLSVEDVPMSSCDVSPMQNLKTLKITGAGLTALDLQWNRSLRSLELTGNHLGEFSLSGVNGSYEKYQLSYIVLRDNEITSLKLNDNQALVRLDISHNNITTLNFTDAESLEYLDMSYNSFEELKINYGSSLKWLDASHNKLNWYMGPETNVLENLNLSYNDFTYANMPAREGLDDAHYIYAPQNDVQLTEKSPGVDLRKEYVTIDGYTTQFVVKTENGTVLTAGSDYSIDGGLIKFYNMDAGKVFIEMTNGAYPSLSGDKVLKTTLIQPATMPTNVIAEFTTTKKGESVRLALAAAEPNTPVYIDWSGNGSDLQEYVLQTTYTAFTATTQSYVKVKVYSYSDDNNLTVFSLSGATIRDFNGEKLNRLTGLFIYKGGTPSLKLPDAPLKELTLTQCGLSQLDLSRYTNLEHLNLTLNNFTSLDVSGMPELQTLNIGSNKLESLTLNNPKLWHLDASGNNFTEFNTDGIPAMEQMWLSNNKLSHINIDNIPTLKCLYIDNNCFKMSDMPLPRTTLVNYGYAYQANIAAECVEGVVDLSSEAMIGDNPTTYVWYLGEPSYDSEGNLVGEELFVDDEYTLENGVTTFAQPFQGVTCYMYNDTFPYLTQRTGLLNVTSGLQLQTTDGVDAEATYFGLDGKRVLYPEAGKIYIVLRGHKVTKELLR